MAPENAAPGDGGDIIIKSGSVDLIYDETYYPTDPENPNIHTNSNGKIIRIVITGDVNYDSGECLDGLECEIKTSCR
ncbi:MAG TPA: hypothetical protein VGO68_00610 [Pyrinomonadaceae bacterium]|jgi:hypothetical protein|nr:hypothetical protein [Pyrinomonadaceae bacterium]